MGGSPGKIELEDVARVPQPGRGALSRRTTKFTADGSRLVYLHSPEGCMKRELAVLDILALKQGRSARPVIMPIPEAHSPAEETLEEQMRRERLRDLGEGISGFCLARTSGHILTQHGSKLWVADGPGAPMRLAYDCPLGVPSDVRLTNDGKQVSCVLNEEVFVMQLSDPSTFRQLTQPSKTSTGKTSRGVADFVAQEEFERLEGYWWSPDGTMIAFEEVQEDVVPLFRIQHQGTANPHEEEHRYPFAGKRNPCWRLGVIMVAGGSCSWLQMPPAVSPSNGSSGADNEQEYLLSVAWMADSSGLMVTTMSRRQKVLNIHAFDSHGHHCGVLHRETSEVWVNVTRMFWRFEGLSIKAIRRCVANGTNGGPKEGFIMGSERSGFCHLYYHRADGRLSHPITTGECVVVSLEGVSHDSGESLVYFTATLANDPTQQHLFCAPLFGNKEGGPGKMRQISSVEGTHSAIVSATKGYFIDIHSDLSWPESVSLCDLSTGKLIARLTPHLSDTEAERVGALRPPEIIPINNRRGDRLYMALFRPDKSQHGDGPYPTIVSMYGGPHVQLVQRSWVLTSSMREQFYRQRGYLVAKIDNRGSANRGVIFESAIHRNMGDAEVEDQVDGLKWLVEQQLSHPDKVVSMGWSYGGYMAARVLMHPDSRGKFAGAVAGAPVTHWDGYDTGYTERYMGTPEDNPEGYDRSSLFKFVDEMQGKLLLVHGLLDENVHFRHTGRLISHLITARKRYQLLVFPEERHMPRHMADRVYMEEAVMDFVDGVTGSQ